MGRPEAYDVALSSLKRHASVPVSVQPITLDDLIKRKLYTRDVDPLASTEFTYSRSLTTALAGFNLFEETVGIGQTSWMRGKSLGGDIEKPKMTSAADT